MELRNYTEEAVRDFVEKKLPGSDACQCEGCKYDIMAYILNNMDHKYVVSDSGAMYAQLSDFDMQWQIDFTTNMELAIKAVKKRPKHCLNNPNRRKTGND